MYTLTQSRESRRGLFQAEELTEWTLPRRICRICLWSVRATNHLTFWGAMYLYLSVTYFSRWSSTARWGRSRRAKAASAVVPTQQPVSDSECRFVRKAHFLPFSSITTLRARRSNLHDFYSMSSQFPPPRVLPNRASTRLDYTSHTQSRQIR